MDAESEDRISNLTDAWNSKIRKKVRDKSRTISNMLIVRDQKSNANPNYQIKN